MNIKMILVGLGVVLLVGVGAFVFSGSKVAEVPIEDEYADLINVSRPIANSGVVSPLVVEGRARGQWYFEASFPVKLLDANGKELVAAPAQAQGDWMTEEFVPFVAILVFETPTTKTGTIVLKNDNPSGLPENEKEIRIPVQFSDFKETRPAKFDRPILLNVKDKITFPDGLALSLDKINDSRCMKGVVCIWAGELSTVFSVTGGNLGKSLKEIAIGTSRNKSVTLNGYTLSLISATESTATIMVSIVTSAESGLGSVNGYIHLGSICPVQQEPPDPKCDIQPYANAKIDISSKASGILIKSVISDSKGNFTTKLEAGTYTAAIYQKTTLSLPNCPITEVIVKAKQITKIDIACDNGIR